MTLKTYPRLHRMQNAVLQERAYDPALAMTAGQLIDLLRELPEDTRILIAAKRGKPKPLAGIVRPELTGPALVCAPDCLQVLA